MKDFKITAASRKVRKKTCIQVQPSHTREACVREQVFALLQAHGPPEPTATLRRSEQQLILHFWKQKGKCIFTHCQTRLEPTMISVNHCSESSLGIRGAEHLAALPRSTGERPAAGSGGPSGSAWHTPLLCAGTASRRPGSVCPLRRTSRKSFLQHDDDSYAVLTPLLFTS